MVLVLNCMKETQTAQSFDRAILRPITKTDQEAKFVWMSQGQEIPVLSRYSHIIISGSEASALDNNPWEDQLMECIHQIIDLKKPLLGICYGHQFLARTLLSKESVRQSQTPEFGWLKVSLTENPLFDGLREGTFMVSHYDEIYNLNDDFKLLAATPRCAAHAFQYRDLPVWGVQFHPEYNIEEANEIFDLVREIDPALNTYFFDSLQNGAKIQQNEQIFLNFFNFV